MPDDDGVLIERCLAGAPEAFEALVRRHAPAVLGFLTSRTRDRAVAEDLTQETFLKAIRALPRYRHRGRLLAWLLRIAGNLATDRDRRRAVHDPVSADAPARSADGGVGPAPIETLRAPEASDPAAAAERAEAAVRARAEVDRLPPLQREVFLLRLEGLSYKEIARLQGCPVNTALGRMHDAVQSLRKRLKELEMNE